MTIPSFKIVNFFVVIFSIASIHALAKSYVVASMIEFDHAQNKVMAGDTIFWKEGRYVDLPLILQTNDVFFLAKKSGGTTFSGSTTFEVKGDRNTISGFQFIGGKIEGDVVDISGNNNSIEHVNVHSYDSHYYLRVRPNCQYNRISYCNFEAKPETQESSVVQIEATDGLPGYHVVSHCSFKKHTAPPGSGADYGIEALRIGYSYQRNFTSRTIVEYCYFEKCNGDYEIISCKARENIMRYNTFKNNGPAHLTLRHGSKNVVYGNFFIDGAGVRIKEGQDQAVINNYFDTGDQMAIQLQNHPFDPVDTVYILNNCFISSSSLLMGGEGDDPPRNVLLANNLFSSSINPIFVDPTHNERWVANAVQDPNNVPAEGFYVIVADVVRKNHGLAEIDFPGRLQNLPYENKIPVYNIPVLDDDPGVEYDIMKQKRIGDFVEIPGCFIPTDQIELALYATSENTGPLYLHK